MRPVAIKPHTRVESRRITFWGSDSSSVYSYLLFFSFLFLFISSTRCEIDMKLMSMTSSSFGCDERWEILQTDIIFRGEVGRQTISSWKEILLILSLSRVREEWKLLLSTGSMLLKLFSLSTKLQVALNFFIFLTKKERNLVLFDVGYRRRSSRIRQCFLRFSPLWKFNFVRHCREIFAKTSTKRRRGIWSFGSDKW